MVNTKQTKHGAKSHRPVGMQEARFSNVGEQGQQRQFEDITEEDWLDLDAPPAAQGEGDTSKSAGKEGDKPTPTETEEGAQAPSADDPDQPQEPQASTSQQDPTDPQDPQAGTSTDDPGLKVYVDSYMQAAQDWLDNVQMHTQNFMTNS